MRRQVRRNVFETNSSSVHSITMCSRETYSKWAKGELYKDYLEGIFKTREEIIEELKTEKIPGTEKLVYSYVDWDDTDEVNRIIALEYWVTKNQYDEDMEYETFYDTYTTSSGEEVVAFGYFGHD